MDYRDDRILRIEISPRLCRPNFEKKKKKKKGRSTSLKRSRYPEEDKIDETVVDFSLVSRESRCNSDAVAGATNTILGCHGVRLSSRYRVLFPTNRIEFFFLFTSNEIHCKLFKTKLSTWRASKYGQRIKFRVCVQRGRTYSGRTVCPLPTVIRCGNGWNFIVSTVTSWDRSLNSKKSINTDRSERKRVIFRLRVPRFAAIVSSIFRRNSNRIFFVPRTIERTNRMEILRDTGAAELEKPIERSTKSEQRFQLNGSFGNGNWSQFRSSLVDAFPEIRRVPRRILNEYAIDGPVPSKRP